jgi:hypothetical protein
MNAKNSISRVWMTGIFCLAAGASYAQIPGPISDLVKQIRAHNSPNGMSYNYDITLKRLSTNTIVDSVKGRLCNGKNHYRDSNSLFFTARAGDYYCKLHYQKKTATVYNVKLLAARLRLNLAEQAGGSLYDITDAMLLENAQVSIDTSDKRIYSLRFKIRDHKLSYLRLDLQRCDYALVGAQMEATEMTGPDDADQYRRIYRIYNVRKHTDHDLMDLSGIFSLANGKVILNRKYTNYTLTELVR